MHVKEFPGAVVFRAILYAMYIVMRFTKQPYKSVYVDAKWVLSHLASIRSSVGQNETGVGAAFSVESVVSSWLCK